MGEDNLLCVRKRNFVVTTDSNHGRKVYPNLAATMVLTGMDQLWRADITYVRLREEFIFVAVILDAYSRRVIGWALDWTMVPFSVSCSATLRSHKFLTLRPTTRRKCLGTVSTLDHNPKEPTAGKLLIGFRVFPRRETRHGVFPVAFSELTLSRAVSIHHPNRAVRLKRIIIESRFITEAILSAVPQNIFPVTTPHSMCIVGWKSCQALQIRTIWLYGVNVEVAVLLSCKKNARTVGRPVRQIIHAGGEDPRLFCLQIYDAESPLILSERTIDEFFSIC